MTAINQDGQVFFTFEELDFDGALQDVLSTVRKFQDFLDADEFDSKWAERVAEKKIDKYLKVALYLERLKRGQNYA